MSYTHRLMDTTVLVIFLLVYLGMVLGEIPGLALDRTGIALLGAIAVVAGGKLSLEEAWVSIDVPTMALLFGLMVVSAQFRLGGFYAHVTRRLTALELRPEILLAALIGVTGLLSAVLANDIVCLAMAPVLVESCLKRGLRPTPFLIALACAANVGSAATLIGNPQNMLIGQALDLSFSGYLWDALVPVGLGLGVVWWVTVQSTRGDWSRNASSIGTLDGPRLNRWQSSKGLVVLGFLILAFLGSPWPRDVLTLAAAGVLLSSRRMASREILGLVDWHLLVLFVGLFIVNRALAVSGSLEGTVQWIRLNGIDPTHPAWLFALAAVLSNLVSNVPAVMLLLPQAVHPVAGPVLAISSTLAGNLLIVGSVANIIVVDQASRLGVRITWREHARVGIPVTILTLLLAAVWLVFRYNG